MKTNNLVFTVENVLAIFDFVLMDGYSKHDLCAQYRKFNLDNPVRFKKIIFINETLILVDSYKNTMFDINTKTYKQYEIETINQFDFLTNLKAWSNDWSLDLSDLTKVN